MGARVCRCEMVERCKGLLAKVWDGMQCGGYESCSCGSIAPNFLQQAQKFVDFYWPKTSCMVLCVLYLNGYGPGGRVK